MYTKFTPYKKGGRTTLHDSRMKMFRASSYRASFGFRSRLAAAAGGRRRGNVQSVQEQDTASDEHAPWGRGEENYHGILDAELVHQVRYRHVRHAGRRAAGVGWRERGQIGSGRLGGGGGGTLALGTCVLGKPHMTKISAS